MNPPWIVPMENFRRAQAQFPTTPDSWLANILTPKQEAMGTFQLYMAGNVRWKLSFEPNLVLLKPIPQLDKVIFQMHIFASDLKFRESCFFTEWINLTEYIDTSYMKIFDAQGQEEQFDAAAYQALFQPAENTLSIRFDFTVPLQARGGGELYARAIHMSPEKAANKKLDTNNVLAVELGSVACHTMGTAPDINLGFTPPFLPIVCTNVPISWNEYKRFADFFLFTVLGRLIRFDKGLEKSYIHENNENQRGVTLTSRFPEPHKQFSQVGVFTPAGTFIYTFLGSIFSL